MNIFARPLRGILRVCVYGALFISPLADAQPSEEQIHTRALIMAYSMQAKEDSKTVQLLNRATDHALTLAEKAIETPVKNLSSGELKFTFCLSIAKGRITELERAGVENLVRIRYMQIRTVSCAGHVAPQLISSELRAGLARHAPRTND